MKFKSIAIKNFRNFADIRVVIGNKNVFFGMNDIGKTNFLFALRYLFDRDMRKRDVIDSDFHKRNVSEDIDITVCIDIQDTESPDTQKLRAKLKGAIGSTDTEIYIKLIAKYNKIEKRADLMIFWGGNKDKLTEVKSSSGGFFELDSVFNVIYINSYIDLHDLFKKNIHALIRNGEGDESGDGERERTIKAKVDEINSEIASLSGIKSFQEKLTPTYKKMRDESVSISIKSDFAISSLYSSIVPFIHQDDDDNEYPTSGEGRKKLLAYSVYNILSDETADKKINLFLIEEPETHLHRTMQSALSHFLFDTEANDGKLNYLFISTHSPFVLSEMDDVHLVRLYNVDKIQAASELYDVPADWEKTKKKLNRTLSEAIFSDSVLLVEGESECILFERVLAEIDPFYESKGIYILSVEGVGFAPYIKMLSALSIRFIIKTDNDISKVQNSNPTAYRYAGFERINMFAALCGDFDDSEKIKTSPAPTDNLPNTRRTAYDSRKSTIDTLREKFKLQLSHCDLEEDLCEALGGTRFAELMSAATAAEAIKRLKSKKQHIMIELVGQLSKDDCSKIYAHYNFACLKAVRNEA